MKTFIGMLVSANDGIEYPDVPLASEARRDARLIVDHDGDVVTCLFVLVEDDSVPGTHEVRHGSQCIVDLNARKGHAPLAAFNNCKLEIALALGCDATVVGRQIMGTVAWPK